MTRLITTLAIITVLLTACTQNKDTAYISGTWQIENLNTVDSSANRSALLNTFIVENHVSGNLLSFSRSKKLLLQNAEGQEIGSGTYTWKGDTLTTQFDEDNNESMYATIEKLATTLHLTAWAESETVNITLSKQE